MATRVVQGGRVLYASPDWRRRPESVRAVGAVARGPGGGPLDSRPVTAAPAAPKYEDTYREDGLVYRVVSRLDLREGWATAAFWCARWRCSWEVLAWLVSRGWLEGAMEAGSPTRRYLCRDELAVLAWLGAHPEARATPAKKRGRTR